MCRALSCLSHRDRDCVRKHSYSDDASYELASLSLCSFSDNYLIEFCVPELAATVAQSEG